MCEVHAFIIKDGQEEQVLESVDQVEIVAGDVKMTNIFGEQRLIKARFRRYDNRQGKIVFELV
jgi:predicted RNA-binding protein